jgi:predicted glutamine amidotransferase
VCNSRGRFEGRKGEDWKPGDTLALFLDLADSNERRRGKQDHFYAIHNGKCIGHSVITRPVRPSRATNSDVDINGDIDSDIDRVADNDDNNNVDNDDYNEDIDNENVDDGSSEEMKFYVHAFLSKGEQFTVLQYASREEVENVMDSIDAMMK